MAKRHRKFRAKHHNCTRRGLYVLVGICMGWVLYNKVHHKKIMFWKSGKQTKYIERPTLKHLIKNGFIKLSPTNVSFELTTAGFDLAYTRMKASGVKLKNYNKDKVPFKVDVTNYI